MISASLRRTQRMEPSPWRKRACHRHELCHTPHLPTQKASPGNHLRRGIAAGLAALVLAVPQLALAEAWSLHLLFNGQMGVTDNIFQVPSNSPDGNPREADAFFVARTGGLWTYETGRTTHEVTLVGDGIANAKNRDAWSLGGNLNWRTHIALNARSEVSVSATGATGTVNTIVARSAVPGSALAPTGNSRFSSADLSQQFAHEVSYAVRVRQNARAQVVRVNTESTTTASTRQDSYTAELSGAIDRSWRADALAGELGATWLGFATPGTMTATLATNADMINLRMGLQWRRDLTPNWTSVVAGGVVAVAPVASEAETVIVPTISGNLAYLPTWGTAGVNAQRTVVPNLFIAQNTVTDAVGAYVNMPLPWLSRERANPKWSAAGTVGFSRTQLVDTARGRLASSFDIFTADLGLAYALSESLSASLRYQFIRQSGNADALTVIQGYARNTVLLALSARLPGRKAATIPTRDTLRVDRSNITAPNSASSSPAAR